MRAGVIAVPLSVPMAGIHDQRVTAVMCDASPSFILTTTALEGQVSIRGAAGRERAPTVLPLTRSTSIPGDAPPRTGHPAGNGLPAIHLGIDAHPRWRDGVEPEHGNQLRADHGWLFPDYGKVSPPGTSAVSWLPLYHDMGLILSVCAPILGGWHSVFTSPMSFLARPARWMQLLAANPRALTAAPNFAFDLAAARTSDADMAGLDLGDVLNVLSGSERVHVATLKRFAQRFGRFNLREQAITAGVRTRRGDPLRRRPRARRGPYLVSFDPEKFSGGHATLREDGAGTALVSYGNLESPVLRIVDPETAFKVQRDRSVRSGSTATTSAWGTGRNPSRPSTRSKRTSRLPRRGPPKGPGCGRATSGSCSTASSSSSGASRIY